MIIQLENDVLKVMIDTVGAELRSVSSGRLGIEYMWNGDPGYWGRISPVLFPFIGKLKDNKYTYQGKEYSMTQHGFARDMEFEIIDHSSTHVVLYLKDNEKTLEKYPFNFSLYLNYYLKDDQLELHYKIENPSENKELLFSIGAHPGFKIPLLDSDNYEDYHIEFNEMENAQRYLIQDGLIGNEQQDVFDKSSQIQLSKKLFYNDALVFKNLKSNVLSIHSDNHDHGISIKAKDFPFYGIWSKRDADFICLEPWCGIADSISANSRLEEKEGINKLLPGEKFKRLITFRFF